MDRGGGGVPGGFGLPMGAVCGGVLWRVGMGSLNMLLLMLGWVIVLGFGMINGVGIVLWRRGFWRCLCALCPVMLLLSPCWVAWVMGWVGNGMSTLLGGLMIEKFTWLRIFSAVSMLIFPRGRMRIDWGGPWIGEQFLILAHIIAFCDLLQRLASHGRAFGALKLLREFHFLVGKRHVVRFWLVIIWWGKAFWWWAGVVCVDAVRNSGPFVATLCGGNGGLGFCFFVLLVLLVTG